ncbi:glycosyltransferase family 2 protein [Microbacterium aurantiacum]|uniref:Glycosyltransferase family 2 protein n=1 Tax=Microbacterium aurantiacum TaxID=162393 RepID=A0AAJ2LV57_9MICO|nr:glycosyltransferase family 2 protein [Microbacterium aurantiacum]MDS0244212.1 glycosyltransferase family 2 protein [Microbacterium aurantiacum]
MTADEIVPQIAVVIVNYNTADETAASIASVLAMTRTPTEIVVVDNGSRDGSVETLRARFPEIAVVDAGENLGFAAGVNRGVAHTTAPWVLLLNPDTVVLDGAIDALLAYARAHPEHRVYGGRTVRPDGSTDPSSCWGAMSLWSLACFATGLSTAFKRSRIFDPESLGSWQRDSVREVPIITGCLLLISREDWTLLGGMDETYFLYGEDADFSARAWEHGMRPVIVPSATIIHAVGGSTASSGRKMSMVMAGKATVLRRRWHPAAAAIGIALLQVGTAVRALPAGARGRRGTTWQVVWGHRRAWRTGYPASRPALFGDAPAEPTTRTTDIPLGGKS